MKIGIIGLYRSGKATVFEALTGLGAEAAHRGETLVGTVDVPDKRLETLADMFKPQRTVYAKVEYVLPGQMGQKHEGRLNPAAWTNIRDCEALIHVVRNFGGYGFEDPRPVSDFTEMEQELILADLVVVEKRLERLEQDGKKGKKFEPELQSLLAEVKKYLDEETPLRKVQAAGSPLLRGYAFLSAKPMLVLFNNPDEVDEPPEVGNICDVENCLVMRGKLEQELTQMSAEEAGEFLSEFGISASAMDRVIKRSYELLGLISFFTVGDDEVRAWTIRQGTEAVDAAEAVHSDMKKGFIRAEVIGYDDLMKAGGMPEARKQGLVRLEGKTYQVLDGDVISFRFNV